MKRQSVTGIASVACLLAAGGAYAQQHPSAPDLDAVPAQMPFNVPFGTPISLEKAQALIQAAIAEANKRGWPVDFAVVDWGGNLVAFARMDGAQLASIAIAERKARAAARYRRPTRAWENAVQQSGLIGCGQRGDEVVHEAHGFLAPSSSATRRLSKLNIDGGQVT